MYYYKIDGVLYSFKKPLSEKTINKHNVVVLTEQEYNELTNPQERPIVLTLEQIARVKKVGEIAHLKSELKKTDYTIIKIAEAETAEEQAELREEYAETIALRKQQRARINELENELNGGN